MKTIIIPGKPNIKALEERVDKALSHAEEDTFFFVSGYKSNGLPEEYQSEAHVIQEMLRKKGVKEKNIHCDDKAQNSIQNLVHAIDYGITGEVGVASNPAHLDRFDLILKSVRKKERVDLHLVRLEVSEKPFDRFYESLVRQYDRWRLRKPLREIQHEAPAYKKIIDLLHKYYS